VYKLVPSDVPDADVVAFDNLPKDDHGFHHGISVSEVGTYERERERKRERELVCVCVYVCVCMCVHTRTCTHTHTHTHTHTGWHLGGISSLHAGAAQESL
jgi:hypothetical protein